MMKRLLTATALATVSASLLSASGYAAPQKDDSIENMVVTAMRREVPLEQVGASISVLSAEDLQTGQFTFALDALQTVPGVTINQNGAFGGIASVRIRGASGDQTAILIDGVQMNDAGTPGGGYDYANINPADIERIEVLRGPQSVLYGSDAVGGVINIITKTGDDGGFGGSYRIEGGAFNTFSGALTVRGGDQLRYRFTASGVDTDGISKADSKAGNTEKDGYQNLSFSGKVAADLAEDVTLEVLGRYTDTDADTDSFGPADGPDMSKTEEFSTAGRLFVNLFGGRLENTLSVEYAEVKRDSISAFGSFPTKSERLNLDYLGHLALDGGCDVTFGGQHEEVETDANAPVAFSIDGLFADLAWQPVEGLTLTGGLRYDDHETFGGATTGRVTAAYVINATGTKLRGTWGEGFKAPSAYQLTYICTFCGLTAPNTALQPERAKAFEAGIDQDLLDGAVTVSATWFQQKTRDMIAFDFAQGYINLDRTRARGVELGLAARPSDVLTLHANYTYTSAIDRTTDTALIRQPKHHASAQATWLPVEDLSTTVAVTYNGKEPDTAGLTVPDWVRVDVKAAYRISDAVEIYGRIDNLFDEDYQQVLGYGTPGISAYMGLRGSF